MKLPIALTVYLLCLTGATQAVCQDSEWIDQLRLKAAEESFLETKSKAEQGDPSAQFKLGSMYLEGLGVKKDLSTALKWLGKSAEQGNTGAEFALGMTYYLGAKGELKPDYPKAAKFLTRAADKGDAYAQANLGRMYFFGNGVERNVGRAVELFNLSAQQKCASGQHCLGLCFLTGSGVKRDVDRAMAWFRYAAKQDYSESKATLGWIYMQSGTQDFDLAASYFLDADKQDNMQAKHGLGILFLYKKTDLKETKKTFGWILAAAEMGVGLAQLETARRFADGEGVVADLVYAQVWSIVAEKNGQKVNKRLADQIKKSLTNQEFEFAKTIADKKLKQNSKLIRTASDSNGAEIKPRKIP